MIEGSSLSEHHLHTLRKRMETFDAMPPEWRELVHEFGSTFVSDFYQSGLKVRVARHLIELVLRGAHEIQGLRRETSIVTPAGERVAQAMSALGLPGSGHAVAAEMYRRGMMIIPRRPTRAMVEASMEALPRRQPMKWVGKQRKHEMRLQDALEVAAAEFHGAAGDA